MSLDLRNFVNILINYHSTSVSSSPKGIVTLITSRLAYQDNPFDKVGPNKDGILYSVDDYNQAKLAKGIDDTGLDIYVKAFFGNKGKALQIVGGYDQEGDIEGFVENVLKNLDYKHVIIVSDVEEQILRKAASQSASTLVIDNAIFPDDNTVDTFSGLNEKVFISSTVDLSGKLYNSVESDSAPTFAADTYYEKDANGQYQLLTEAPANWSTNYQDYYIVAGSNPENYIIKVGEKGIEMLAAAYLSQVRVNDAGTIGDYAFTIENVTDFFQNSLIENNDEGVKLVNAHFNFNTTLVNATRNYPGDTVTGNDMMNFYVRILLVQDLTEAIMNLLASKIRFNQSGINRLSNAISQQMNVYISNGYLNTDAIWTKDTLTYNFNGVDYVICTRNTPLAKGYRCVILPLSSLTDDQKEAHVLPPVYLLLADQTGIRQVVIRGDVF